MDGKVDVVEGGGGQVMLERRKSLVGGRGAVGAEEARLRGEADVIERAAGGAVAQEEAVEGA